MSDQTSSGATTQSVSDVPENKSGDVVKYETYSRVLSEAKKLKEQLRAVEAERQQSQEQKLKEQNEWKVLAEQYKSKYESATSTLQEQEKSIVNGLKFQEFEKHIGGKLKDREYAQFVDFDRIVLDPETKRVNEDSAKAVAADFIKRHSSLVEFAGGAKLPNQAATSFKGSGGKNINEMSAQELEKFILEQYKTGNLK